MSTLFDLNTVFSRDSQLVSTELDDEMVVMDDEKGAFFGLNSTAKLIYGLLDSPRTLGELIDLLTAQYAVSAEQCQQDITPFLEMMLTSKLLIASHP